MNSFVNRFSASSASSDIKRAKELLSEEDGVDALWGSQAGFSTEGNKLLPSFAVPTVLDVRRAKYDTLSTAAYALSIASPRRSCGCIRTTMPTLRARSRSITVPPPSHLDTKVVLLLR